MYDDDVMSLTMITMYQCYLVLIPCCKIQYYVTQNKMGNEIQCTHRAGFLDVDIVGCQNWT